MHISEGVLSAPVLAGGAVLAAAGVAAGLKALKDDERLVTVGLLSAAFFVASLVHVPVGPGNVHLVLNGLLGVMLGWAAFPAICVTLLLQAVLFQFGGLTVLGVNTVSMALPAVLCGILLRPLLAGSRKSRALGAFLCGFLSVAGAALTAALALAASDEGFLQSARILLAAHVPVMAIEGAVTMFLVSLLARTKPELLRLRSGEGGR